MSYLISKRDVITIARNTLNIKNEFGSELGLKLQDDGKLCISVQQGGRATQLRLSPVEVQHLRELLNAN